MAKIESYTPGSFCWAELATSDTASAKKLYTGMFDWTVLEHAMPQGIYTIFQSEGNDVGAMHGGLQPGVPPNWAVYFSVTSVDESSAKIASLGGKVVAGPFDVMDKGRMAVAQDPQGAMFSLWQPMKHPGATHGGPLNQISWPELTTPDPAGAVAFYTGLFGWKTKPETGAGTAEYVEWINAGKHIGGLMPMRGNEWHGVPSHWMIYVTVADCDRSAAKAQELGGKICIPPNDIPNVGRFAVINDAQGAVFSVIKLTQIQKSALA